MADRTYLGIDAGTSVVKAAIFDERGNALAVHGRPIPLMHDRGGVAVEARQASKRWREAMPACLQPYWPQMQDFEVDLEPRV